MDGVLSGVWISLSFDRWLALSAIVVGIAAVIRVEWLFEKLYKREQ